MSNLRDIGNAQRSALNWLIEYPDKRTQLLQIAEGLLSLASVPADAKRSRHASDASHAAVHLRLRAVPSAARFLAPREWARTTDLTVNSRPLYQLSYRGMERADGFEPPSSSG